MNKYFQKALPIWAKGKEEELNSSLFFKTVIDESSFDLTIAAHNFYRLWIDGKFFAYGPSRDAHDYYRVDHYAYQSKRSRHVVVIEVSGYNCNSFYALNRTPFLQCEILNRKGEVKKATGFDFSSFNNETRLRKVTRFSYQRAFSESYRMDPRFKTFLTTDKNPYEMLEVSIQEGKRLEKRIVDYPLYQEVPFSQCETGKTYFDKSKKVYEDRYQVLDYLKIFPMSEWEIDSNRVASTLGYRLERRASSSLKENQFITYETASSTTGFLSTVIDVQEDALIYILFDEVNIPTESDPSLIGLSFYRNTTHNCVTYSLAKGKYRLISFEPYTLKYARIICLKGACSISSFSLISYENPDTDKFTFSFADKRIDSIFQAAVNTFKQNALDVLTDCPSRERAGWLCDSYWSGQAESLITGKNLVEKAFLDCYAKCEKKDLPFGMVPMCYPADFPSKEFIPNWALWYILELANYARRVGDKKLIEDSKPNIEGVLAYFKNFENELGLLEDLKGWIFVEWSKANDEEFIKGINFPSNMLYAQALLEAGYLLKDKALTKKGNELKQTIKKLSFNGEFFVDNALRDESHHIVLTDHTTETCQYYALYFGIISPKEDPSFFLKLVNNFGEYRDEKTVYPTVYKSNLLMGIMMRLSILNRYGLASLVFKETIEYFFKMSQLTGTLWEHDSVFASLNHCFTSYIINIFLDANFGLEAIDYKKKIIVMRKNALLEEGRVRLPLGGNALVLAAKNKELRVKKPRDYVIQWK